jgi:hypothetical protein
LRELMTLIRFVGTLVTVLCETDNSTVFTRHDIHNMFFNRLEELRFEPGDDDGDDSEEEMIEYEMDVSQNPQVRTHVCVFCRRLTPSSSKLSSIDPLVCHH